MNTPKIILESLTISPPTTLPIVEPTARQLSEAPDRAFAFLRAVGTHPIIQQLLLPYGYTSAQHQEGWDLVLSVAGTASDVSTARNPVVDAIELLDAWAEPNLLRARAAIKRTHPDRVDFLFHDLPAARGPDAFLAVATFLERCDTLEHGTKADKAVLDTLAERGITKQVRKQLDVLVEIVRAQKQVAPVATSEAQAARIKQLRALYAWLEDWTETARTVITRRDLLIRLGVAKRRGKKAKGGPIFVPPTPAPAPIPEPIVVAPPPLPAVPNVPILPAPVVPEPTPVVPWVPSPSLSPAPLLNGAAMNGAGAMDRG